MTGMVYTYAVARPFDPARLAGLRGIDSAGIHLVRHREVVAVVSPLPAASADESALRARLETLEELEVMVRAHHAVVEAVSAQSVTLPLRLATLHHGDARVADALREGYEGFCVVLDRLAGRVELGVKIHAGVRDASRAEPTESEDSPSSTPGRDYLRRLHRQRHQREDARQHAGADAARVDAALSELAVDRRHHRPQAPPLSGRSRERAQRRLPRGEAAGGGVQRAGPRAGRDGARGVGRGHRSLGALLVHRRPVFGLPGR
jgi:Gas vesicle synthesis protein GvpL/GvpF